MRFVNRSQVQVTQFTLSTLAVDAVYVTTVHLVNSLPCTYRVTVLGQLW